MIAHIILLLRDATTAGNVAGKKITADILILDCVTEAADVKEAKRSHIVRIANLTPPQTS